MSQDLKPCPFCNQPPHVFPSGDGTGVMIECVTAGCVNPHTSWYGEGVAKAAWNARPLQAEGAPAAEGARALRSEDLAYLKRLLARDLPVAHCGEGDLDRRDREAWEERHANIIAALSPPAAEGKEDPAERTAIGCPVLHESDPPCDGCDCHKRHDAALSHTPAPAAEPVGWRVKDFADGWFFYGADQRAEADRAGLDGFLVEPLYASPPPQPGAISREEIARIVDPEALTHTWEGGDEQQDRMRVQACKERREQWGEDDCDAKDGSCEECTLDMAEALETPRSKHRRASALAKADAILARIEGSPSLVVGGGK